MNKLNESHYCVCTSKEERNELLNKLRNHGMNIAYSVWEERNDEGDYENWPVVVVEEGVNGPSISVAKQSMVNNKTSLTVDEFLMKAGILITPHGDSSIKHYFLGQ